MNGHPTLVVDRTRLTGQLALLILEEKESTLDRLRYTLYGNI